MNPQSSPLLAGRVALERFDTVDHHRRPRAHRRAGFLARSAQAIAARAARLIASPSSEARAAETLPIRSGSDG